MTQWVCSVCGYQHQGELPPEKCPNCGAVRGKFSLKEDSIASIHIYYGEKLFYGSEVRVNPFFGDYESIAPFIYNLPVGVKVPLHKHPTTDELFFIVRGKVKFRVGDSELVATKGDIVQGKMDIPHSFENVGDEPAAFLSVKGPKPVDLVKLE